MPLITTGKSGAAVDYLKKIIEQDPKNEVLVCCLGQAYEQLKMKPTLEKLMEIY
jgi:predicted Zn-dependent protease